MGKIISDKLTEKPSEQNIEEVAKEVIEKCRRALGDEDPLKKKKASSKTCFSKLSLNVISEDIKEMLSKLTKKKSRRQIDMRLQQKEFFKFETNKKIKTKKAGSPGSGNTNVQQSPSNCKENDSLKKPGSGNSSKCGSLNTIQSSSIFKKVPVTRSDMKNFKKKVELTSLESITSPDLVRLIDKEKVAKNVGSLMKNNLSGGETNPKMLIGDVSRFIRRSLEMSTIPEDLADVKKIAEAKRIGVIPSDTAVKLEKLDEVYNRKKHEEVTEKKPTKSNQNDSNINQQKPVETTNPSNKTKPKVNVKQAKNQQAQKMPNSTSQVSQKISANGEKKPPIGNKQQTAANTGKNKEPEKQQVGQNKKDGNQIKNRSNITLRSSVTSANYKALSLQKSVDLQRNSQRKLPAKRTPPSPDLQKQRQCSKTSNFSIQSNSSRPSRTNSGLGRNRNPVASLKEEVSRAIQDRKTFTVAGNYPAVRNALVRRGWVEKYSSQNRDKLEYELENLRNKSINQLADLLQVRNLNEICKRLIKSKMLGSHQVDLYWGRAIDAFRVNSDKVKLTKINRFKRDVFSYTSKQGLCQAAKDAHWVNFPGLARINHPRTYVLSRNGEMKDFVRDFRRTAAMSLLKWIIKNNETKECKVVSSSGKIPLEAFQFACNECYKMVIEANNQDIDHPLKEANENEWSQFLQYYYKIMHIGNHFRASNAETESSIVEKSQYLIEKLTPHYPHMRMDGTMNIWILKPVLGSQGKGIHICRTLQYIINTIKTNNKLGYIAQKYIERPLLIFNTKFDIRQWFLISSAFPLTIWMYKECYLRFSSQTYNLRKLHESVHLTNNSVQKNYQNNLCDITLPRYNMWDSVEFRNYLSNIGYPDIYRRVIYKGMKECIIGAVMIHQDKIDKRKNCFELYGADFMLTEDFQPWLIEINSSPALFPSTPITSRMCPQVLEDTIKVIIDRAANPKAKTGNFELIYKQPNVRCANANLDNLKVSGTPLPDDYFCQEEEEKAGSITPLSIIDNLEKEKRLSKTKSETVVESVRETLEKLLKFIENEKKHRRKKLVAKGTDPILPAQESIGKSAYSFASMRSSLNLLACSSRISFTKEDENMLDQALKMLKSNREGEVVRYLLDVLERIASRVNVLET